MKSWITGFFVAAASVLNAQTENAVVEQLNQASDQAALNAAIKQAQGWGLPQQMLIEAELSYGIRKEDLSYLKEMIPRAQSASKDFNSSRSSIKLQSESQWRGMIAFAQALLAREDEDVAEFEKQALRAVWLYPEKAAYFGQTISQYQRLQRLSRHTLNLTQNLATASGGTLTLGDLTAEGKALLLVFWSSDVPPSEQAWERLSQRAVALKLAGVALAGVSIKPLGKEETCVQAATQRKLTLLVDVDLQLAQTLEIKATPQVILLSVQGRVLYAGHPDDPGLRRSLLKLAPVLNWN